MNPAPDFSVRSVSPVPEIASILAVGFLRMRFRLRMRGLHLAAHNRKAGELENSGFLENSPENSLDDVAPSAIVRFERSSGNREINKGARA